MKTQKFLVPVDFSTCSQPAMEMATNLASGGDAILLIVHVEEPPVAYGGGEMYYGIMEPSTDDLMTMLERIVPSDPTVKFEHRLITGDPASAIVRLAEEEQADLIVLGTHGRTGLTRLLMGSVAEAVVRRAKCAVLTLKQPATAPVE